MAKSRRSKGKDGSSILVIIAVLALLAMIGVAIYKLSGQHAGGGNKTCASFQGNCQQGTPKSSTTKCITCTANECCTPRTCASFRGNCQPGTAKPNNTKCNTNTCTANECCTPPTCASFQGTCGTAQAVDTNKTCTGACNAKQCCTLEAWIENEVKKAVTELELGDCNKTAAIEAGKNVLTKKCPGKTGTALLTCAANPKNAIAVTEAVVKACRSK
jgi:hypothetical protein